MKRIVRLGLGSLIIAAIAIGCTKDDDPVTTSDYRNEYLGSWDCTEKTGVNAPQIYSINITADSSKSDGILIHNLYKSGTAVKATIQGGFNLNISTQTTADITFVGSGSANADFQQISLNFTANDKGSGPDVIEAILIR